MQFFDAKAEMNKSTALLIEIMKELGRLQDLGDHVILTGSEKAAAEILERFEAGGHQLDSICVMTPGSAAREVDIILNLVPHDDVPVVPLLDTETGEKYYLFDKKDLLFMKEVEAEALGKARSIKQVETFKLVMDESRDREYALGTIDGLDYKTINRFGELVTKPMFDRNGKRMNWQYSVEKSPTEPGKYCLRFPTQSNGEPVEPAVRGFLLQTVLERKIPEFGVDAKADYKENIIKTAVERFEKTYSRPQVEHLIPTAEDKEYLAKCEEENKPMYLLTSHNTELIEIKSGSYTIYRKPSVGTLRGIMHNDYDRYAKVEQDIGIEGKFAVEDEFKLVNEITAKERVIEVNEHYAEMFKNLYSEIGTVSDPEEYKKREDERIKASNKEIDNKYLSDVGVEPEWNELKVICRYNRAAVATVGLLERYNADLSELRDHSFEEMVRKYVPSSVRDFGEMIADAKGLDDLSNASRLDEFGTNGRELHKNLLMKLDESLKETSKLLKEYSVHSNMAQDLQQMPIEQVIAVYNQKAIETPVKDRVMEMSEEEKAAFVTKLKNENIIFHDKPYEAPENTNNTEER